MRNAAFLAVLVSLTASLQAQTRPGVLVPMGARIKVSASGGNLEGTLLFLSRDSVVLMASEPATVAGRRVPVSMESVSAIRVLQSPAIWSYSTTGNITFFMGVTIPASLPGGLSSQAADARDMRHILLVADQRRLAGIDPQSGSSLWTREDLPNLNLVSIDIVGRSGYAVITRGDTMEIIHLTTGEKRWRTGELSLAAAKGWLPVEADDSLILMYGRSARSNTTLMAVELATGTVRWRQDSLFRNEPKVFGTQGVSYLLGHQTPFHDSDTTLILYISKDGPVRLDARTGALLWRAEAMSNAGIPAPRDNYAGILHSRGTIFIPSGNQLWAFNSESGQPVWNSPRQFRNKVFDLLSTRFGLLVRGEEWVDLLTPETGRSIWSAPAAIKKSTEVVVIGDTAFVAADNEALAIRMSDGVSRSLGKVHFRERERASGFGVLDRGLVLGSWHNLAVINRQGSTVYEEFYPSPGQSLGEGLMSGMVGTPIWRPTTRWSGTDVYFFTGRPDPADRDGFSIVRFDALGGREVSRLWLDDRNPSYVLEPASGSVYYQRSGREIVAMRFADWSALSNAVMNGQQNLVERLLSMGVDVRSAGIEGWTALHVAAWAGQQDIASRLIGAGADLNVRSENGWTPWMLAQRNGFDAMADFLRNAGAQYNEAASVLLRGWYQASKGRIPEALTLYDQARAMDSTLAIFPEANAALCLEGAVAGMAPDVLATCDRALEQAPEEPRRQREARFARGVARAMVANYAGAAADLKESVGAEGNVRDDEWIDELAQERNPFTPTVLACLRRTRAH